MSVKLVATLHTGGRRRLRNRRKHARGRPTPTPAVPLLAQTCSDVEHDAAQAPQSWEIPHHAVASNQIVLGLEAMQEAMQEAMRAMQAKQEAMQEAIPEAMQEAKQEAMQIMQEVNSDRRAERRSKCHGIGARSVATIRAK